MTLLVRDEIDIVRQNIAFHLAHGVDHVIATDNGSVDGTRDVLADFERLGVATVLDEPGRDFSQARWVTRMALMARDRFGADWILNNDADEFWYASSDNLKSALLAAEVDLLECRRCNMVYAFDGSERAAWAERLIYRASAPAPVPRLSNPMSDELPCPYFYMALPPKVLARAKGLKQVTPGNHGAEYDRGAAMGQSDITIFHFPVRSAEQFERKVRHGGEAYARNKEEPAGVGWHWRRWYRKLGTEGLEATIAEVLPSSEQLDHDLSTGRVKEDGSMRDMLECLPFS